MEKFLRSNMFARGLALFLAIALWLFVMGDNITRTTPSRKEFQGVPLTVENLEEGLVITDMPATVSVTLEGLPASFDGLTVDELEAYIDLAEKGIGSHQLRVRGLPPRGLSLVSFSPEHVAVFIEIYNTAVFEVFVDIYGDPAEGWIRKTFSIDPMHVRVEAPQSVFEQIDRVVLRVDQSGLRDQYRQELNPVAVDSRGEVLAGVTLVPDKIMVTITLLQQEEQAP
jgi:YbbR domain-containing protein